MNGAVSCTGLRGSAYGLVTKLRLKPPSDDERSASLRYFKRCPGLVWHETVSHLTNPSRSQVAAPVLLQRVGRGFQPRRTATLKGSPYVVAILTATLKGSPYVVA